MFQNISQGTSAEGITGACRLDRLHGESRSLDAHAFVVRAASVSSHGKQDQRNLVFLLEICDSLVIVFFSRHKLNLIVRDLKDIAHAESILHLLFRQFKRGPQRRS